MHIKDHEAKEMLKSTQSYVDLCNRAIKENPKDPKVNAKMFGPFLNKLLEIFGKHE